jgi:hypothetical protein
MAADRSKEGDMDPEQHDYKHHLILIEADGAGHRTTIRTPDGLLIPGPTTDYRYGKSGLLEDAKRLIDLRERASGAPALLPTSQEPEMTTRFEIAELVTPPTFTEGGLLVLHLVGEMDGVRSTLDVALPRRQAMSLVGEIVRAIQNTMG